MIGLTITIPIFCVNVKVSFESLWKCGEYTLKKGHTDTVCLCGVFCSRQAWSTLQDRQWSSCMRRMVEFLVTFTSLPLRISRTRPTSSLLTKFAKVPFTYISIPTYFKWDNFRVHCEWAQYKNCWFDTLDSAHPTSLLPLHINWPSW